MMFVVGGLALLTLIGILEWRHRRQPHNDPVVDAAVASAPAVHETTVVVLHDADSVMQEVQRLQTTVARLQRRIITREDSIATLEAQLASGDTFTVHDSLTNCLARLGLRTAQKLDADTARTSCTVAVAKATQAEQRVRRQLLVVQRRADSIPTFIKRAVDAKPCTRNWLIVHPTCAVSDVVVFVAGAATGVLATN